MKGKYTADHLGTIANAISFTSTLKVTQGEVDVTDFTIGAITKPPGFSAITVNNTAKTISYSLIANTNNLSDSGTILIPVLIKGLTHTVSFVWSKAKAG